MPHSASFDSHGVFRVLENMVVYLATHQTDLYYTYVDSSGKQGNINESYRSVG